MGLSSRDIFDSDLQRTFDLIRPLLVRACRPIAISFHEIRESYGVTVSSAELEVNFSFTSSGTPVLASSKQDAGITIRLNIIPGDAQDTTVNIEDLK